MLLISGRGSRFILFILKLKPALVIVDTGSNTENIKKIIDLRDKSRKNDLVIAS